MTNLANLVFVEGGLAAARPATPSGKVTGWYAEDTDQLSIWDGAAWHDVGSVGTISEITAADGSLAVTDPTGPTTDLMVVVIEGGTSDVPVVHARLRRDTAANWTANNPTLEQGEEGFEYDTGKTKIGDGSTAWNSLAYQGGGGSGTVTSVGSSDSSLTVANPTTTPDLVIAVVDGGSS